jgi:ABC-type transporter Mla maintaining outer membrane lipid asymmetry ATPase subunit MlaF
MDLIGGLRAHHNAAVVMVTHLVEDGLERADRALLLDRDHDIAMAASPSELRASETFQHLYGRSLARAAVTPAVTR